MRISDWSSDVCSSDLLTGDMRLDARVDVGEGADRAGDCAGGDFLPRGRHPLPAAGEFGISFGQLQAEGNRFGMDAVAAADRSEETRVGQECIRTCRSRWPPSL